MIGEQAMRKIVLLSCLCFAATAPFAAGSDGPLRPKILGYGRGVFEVGRLLASDDFATLDRWVVQQEQRESVPASYALARDNTLDILSPSKGTTAWYRDKFEGPIVVVYRMKCPSVINATKRFMARDLNNFWHCSDPDSAPDVLATGKGGRYTGSFGTYHQMLGYYASTGGGANTTTRFRRYPRRVAGKGVAHLALNDKDGKPDYLLTPDRWYTVQLVAFKDIIQYIVNGVVVYEIRYGDTIAVAPDGHKVVYTAENFPYYDKGWVGFRMTCSHHVYANFRVFELVPAPSTEARAPDGSDVIRYTGDGSDLQDVIDRAPEKGTVACDREKPIVLSVPIVIRKPLTLTGLNARLPEELGKTSLLVVEAAGVAITDVELHGNYDSVSQKVRAPLIKIHGGNFRLERCKFYDSSKDGVEVTPKRGGGDVVGGVIRDIEAFRIGRDAVSISGGNRGERVRDVVIENVSLKKGYKRGAVEVSDGTDNITVRNVYAESCPYGIDVQDHGKGSAPNTNIVVENVEAVRCRHIIRTANRALGHANLTLRNLIGRSCTLPVQISNTKNVTVEGLKVLDHKNEKSPPIVLKNCHGVVLKGLSIESSTFADKPIQAVKCTEVRCEE